MDLSKLNPWNWFKHEQASEQPGSQIPVRRREYNPAGIEMPLQQLHQEFDRLFEVLRRQMQLPFSAWPQSAMDALPTLGTGTFSPHLNISAEEGRYRVSVELPGLQDKDVSLEVSGDRLLLKGRTDFEQEDKGAHYYRIERASGQFQRTLALPDDADVEGIRAKMKDGVLYVDIPRKEDAQTPARSIPINA
ncbi:Hsp20/alpha crystallin family protein [Motiliproteus sp. SC1-56]|uniref:Hsp20/alpha crystallin family protein n=1 Tax=Motiliproteus sp. SC1-56 TaxID=2799565 RepID=UPI001A90A261|nr:Hsp20/alpha crystallin family protein [Motiliproteus sp. SC1-56]